MMLSGCEKRKMEVCFHFGFVFWPFERGVEFGLG